VPAKPEATPTVSEAKAPPPVAPKPAAPPAPVVSDDDLVEQTVRAYAQAYTDMDVAASTRLWPGVTEAVRKSRFAEYRSQSMTIGSIAVDLLANGTAQATVQGSWIMVPRAAARPPSPTRFVFTLRKDAGRWLITGLQPLN
jgi:hypothetical protein